MRVFTVIRKMLSLKLFVTGVSFSDRGMTADVRPTWRKPRCGGCGQPAPRYDRRPPRQWRHLSMGKLRIWLCYAPWRVRCPRCGVKTERVPWAVPGSGFSAAFEELCAYYAQTMDQTAVTRLLGIDWRTVGVIVRRVVEQRLDPQRLDELHNIGIDEFSYRKRHRYMTIVVDHDRKRVVWAGKGKSSETLQQFFELLGPDRCRLIQNVTLDMSEGYIQTVRDRAPAAAIIFDRFHVQKLAGEAVDEVRRELVRQTGDTEMAKTIKGSRWPLLKKPKDLSGKQKLKLSEIEQEHKPLFRAYLLKELLATVLGRKQLWRARRDLQAWLAWASRSRLKSFVRLARTIRRYKEGILAYIELRLTNGLVEGLNNKIRVVARRAYGFHSAEALMGMVMLCCGGIVLNPPLP